MLCIISSGTENLNIVKLCQKLSISHSIVADSQFWPYQDKNPQFLSERIQQIMTYMMTQGATQFILSPSIELALFDNNSKSKIQNSKYPILPLFSNYLMYCLEHSLVGKIGFIGGYADISQVESLFGDISKGYQTTDSQINTKKFALSKWTKDTSMRGYFGRLFSPRNMMINKVIKTNLRYFKDANVDTLIPLDYSYFNYQKIITSFLNQKKHKFHKLDIIENIIKDFIEQNNTPITNNTQLINIYHTGSLHLIQDKKRIRLLSQGGSKTIEYNKIDII